MEMLVVMMMMLAISDWRQKKVFDIGDDDEYDGVDHGGVDDVNCVGDGDDKHVMRDILPASHFHQISLLVILQLQLSTSVFTPFFFYFPSFRAGYDFGRMKLRTVAVQCTMRSLSNSEAR